MSERHSGASPLADVVLADCSSCRHRALLAEGNCLPGDVCVAAHSGRQIDRFLRRNPQEAQDYLQDGFWERRAIAVKQYLVSRGVASSRLTTVGKGESDPIAPNTKDGKDNPQGRAMNRLAELRVE